MKAKTARNTRRAGVPRNTRPRPLAGQMVIAETVASANGKTRAKARHKSVISLRLSSATLAALDVECERRRAKLRREGRNWPVVTRTTLIEEGIAHVVKR